LSSVLSSKQTKREHHSMHRPLLTKAYLSFDALLDTISIPSYAAGITSPTLPLFSSPRPLTPQIAVQIKLTIISSKLYLRRSAYVVSPTTRRYRSCRLHFLFRKKSQRKPAPTFSDVIWSLSLLLTSWQRPAVGRGKCQPCGMGSRLEGFGYVERGGQDKDGWWRRTLSDQDGVDARAV
jgi:hypothetical protein